ncbi:hypothetical protein JOF42_003344 [Microbacterium phyllosphaerae]|uniref:DUF4352 domain-containing protein n=1 Tax=Microbacterium phyllosphaerae TaxID=124798 RepID=A0ABS4WUG8_9MICO|nr:hypothetical protein [Microbacterium phyllosphaerae]MBP2379849.1 hypothetical protein [Microbacterium phyllosphaerae]
MRKTGDHERAAPKVAARAIVRRWVRSLADVPRGIWIAAAALIALLLVVFAIGGFAQAQAAPTELGVGDEARASVYAVTVIDAEFADEVESEYLEAEPGETLLVMTMRMENLSDAPIGVGTAADRTKAGLVNTENPLLDLSGVSATDTVSVWRADGSSGQVILQPGVPSEVTLAWSVPEDAFPDGVVSLDVHEVEVRRGAVILSASVVTWRAAETFARISVTPTGAP